jgi:hypothetical protein
VAVKVQRGPHGQAEQQQQNDPGEGQIDGGDGRQGLRHENRADAPHRQNEAPHAEHQLIEITREDGQRGRNRDQEHQRHCQHLQVGRPRHGEGQYRQEAIGIGGGLDRLRRNRRGWPHDHIGNAILDGDDGPPAHGVGPDCDAGAIILDDHAAHPEPELILVERVEAGLPTDGQLHRVTEDPIVRGEGECGRGGQPAPLRGIVVQGHEGELNRGACRRTVAVAGDRHRDLRRRLVESHQADIDVGDIRFRGCRGGRTDLRAGGQIVERVGGAPEHVSHALHGNGEQRQHTENEDQGGGQPNAMPGALRCWRRVRSRNCVVAHAISLVDPASRPTVRHYRRRKPAETAGAG